MSGVVADRRGPAGLRPDGRRSRRSPRAACRCARSGSTCSISSGVPGEILLRKDVLDRQLINIDGARLVRANEIELVRLDGWYRVVGVDVSLRGLCGGSCRMRSRSGSRRATFLDWASIEPFTGHVPTVRLRVPHPKLARLHPAQLADLVEAASHREGEEIIDAVRSDPELEADLFEELEDTAPARVRRGAERRGDRGAARAYGGRRRGRSRPPACRTERRERSSIALRSTAQATARADAARLRPRDGGRLDEPRVRLPVRRGDARGVARSRAPVDACTPTAPRGSTR